MNLDLHNGKLTVCDVKHGVEFLGAFIKPYRTYVSNASLRRARSNISKMDFTDRKKVFMAVNSYLGMFVHYSSCNIRKELFLRKKFTRIAPFDSDLTKMNKNNLNF